MADLTPEEQRRVDDRLEPLFDRLRCGLMDTVIALEGFQAVCNMQCPCGEQALVCPVHDEQAVDLLEGNGAASSQMPRRVDSPEQ